MQKKMKNFPQIIVYIDGANLYNGVLSLGKNLDYYKFYRWLKEKYKITKAIIFIGKTTQNSEIYKYLEKSGFSLIYKKTYKTKVDKIKGNCDAELILKSIEDAYEKNLQKVILISGDGDFSCLIDFWKRKNILCEILAPRKKYCSLFLKRKNVPLVYIEDIIHKIEKPPREPEV